MSSGKRTIKSGNPGLSYRASSIDSLRGKLRGIRDPRNAGSAIWSAIDPSAVQAMPSDDPDVQLLSDTVAIAIAAGEFDEILGIQPQDLGPGENVGPRRTSRLTA